MTKNYKPYPPLFVLCEHFKLLYFSSSVALSTFINVSYVIFSGLGNHNCASNGCILSTVRFILVSPLLEVLNISYFTEVLENSCVACLPGHTYFS